MKSTKSILWHALPKDPENTINDDENEVEDLSLDELFRGRWNDAPPPSKRQRMTSPALSDPDTVTSQVRSDGQPPREFTATETFWDDYFRQDYARSLEPVDHSRKRKFCD